MMETFLTTQIFKALTEGDHSKVIGYALIFAFLWLGQKKIETRLRDIQQSILKSHGIMRREQKGLALRVEKLEKHFPDDDGIYPRLETTKQAHGGLNL